MYDIEEQVLNHPAVSEAEVIKFSENGEECPAIVVVLRREWSDRAASVLRDLSMINTTGTEYLLGIRFIDRFKTNPITGKRDVLTLPQETTDYYIFDKADGKIYRVNIGVGKTAVADRDVLIVKV